MKTKFIKKETWKPGTVLSPTPAVLVSCGGSKDWKPNIITIAWTGTINSDPPMLSISIRPERFSHEIITSTGEFVVNIPTLKQMKSTDWCGVVSGRKQDKFATTGLTPAKANKVSCPIIMECPINIECKVKQTINLGSHTMFIAEIIAVQVTSSLIDAKGRFCIEKSDLFAYAHGYYFALGKRLGHFGFSVKKK